MKVMIEIITDLNKIENKETKREINETKSRLFDKIT